ncbi:hypothetical protein CYY_006566 [Polysphondylium violaceum]|uniref:Uncharacterized protein n=1 Tax=Polysphondylium violaceum TaxID=133409 RepID=A0A8J4URF3_9MYCE|nr:hypothetical protein CYY_006566 [Polysphondylium violaceum]
MDAIVTKMEETLERKKSIANIVEKRTMVIDYIKRIHEAAYYAGIGTSASMLTNSNSTSSVGGANGGATSGISSTLNTSNSSLSTSNSTSSLSSLNNSSGNLANIANNNQNNNNNNNNNNTIKPIHWMNVAMIQKTDFDSMIQKSDLEKNPEIQKRLLGWFCLGFSLSPLTTADKGPSYIRSLLQLIEEYDYHFELGSAMQGVKVLLSKKQPTHTVVNENEHIKAKIGKIGTTVVYEFLKIFNISIAKDLDYFHVVFSLLEILEQIYKKMDKETCSSKYVYEALLKIDSRLKHHIFGFLAKEIDKMALQIIKDQLDFTMISTSIKDKDIQQHNFNVQSKISNNVNSSNNNSNNNNNNNSNIVVNNNNNSNGTNTKDNLNTSNNNNPTSSSKGSISSD